MSTESCGGAYYCHSNLSTNGERPGGIEESRHLWGIVQAGRETEIPNAVVRNGAELLLRRDGDRDSTILLRDVMLPNRNFLVELDSVKVSNRVVVEVEGIIRSFVLGQSLAVLGLAVELDVDLGAGSDSGVVRDALEDVDTVVVALAPSYT